MKKLKVNQIGPWCSWCQSSGQVVRAVYRENGFRGKFCCEQHLSELSDYEENQRPADSRYTDADHYTWGQQI